MTTDPIEQNMSFSENKLNLYEPRFDSELSEFIFGLEYLRNKDFSVGTTPERWFHGLKDLFFILESVSSARIEGNRTTVAEYIDYIQCGKPGLFHQEDDYQEITNLVEALRFIEETVCDFGVNQMLIRELHKYAVKGLSSDREGDRTPGAYRKGNVKILNSPHRPPEAGDVPSLVAELVDWLNEPQRPTFDLIKIAQAHWRFVWIHPFSNGNGRTARLLTYALLVKYGYAPNGMIVNPNGLFCACRDEYYRHLSEADSLTDDGIENWITFFVKCLRQELESAKRLMDKDFVVKQILLPAIELALRLNVLTEIETRILKNAIVDESIQLKDFAGKDKSEKTYARAIAKLKNDGLLSSFKPRGRVYGFTVAPKLYRFIVERFCKLGLTPLTLEERSN